MSDKDAIYAIGLGVTLVLGIWNLWHNHKTTRKNNFINTVTNQRIQWIEQLRQNIATFLGLTHTWCESKIEGKPEEIEILKELDRLRHLIQLRLNADATLDKKIAALVRKIPDLTQDSQQPERKSAMNELSSLSQELFKEEWEKVKKESKDGDLNEK
ncbi:MAG: hypothetical protein KZQ90_18585 [Candidatus Thiodiazotropha sp. (ex Codakia rugifera)]|nr:hypothetical protein [Candidatus Thiodiazotropha sp. (ex Codakia rugifera)]